MAKRPTASSVSVREQEVADRNSHNLDLKRNVYQEVAVLGNLATGELGCEDGGSCQNYMEEKSQGRGLPGHLGRPGRP